MALFYKQLTRQILKNKVFVALLLLFCLLTSLSFFFVRFSIDGNLAALKAQAFLTDNQRLYQNALLANTSLAYGFLASLTGLAAFVFVMFFYRFFRQNRKQIGCIKALGCRDEALRRYFVLFTAALSLAGALLGMAGGYWMADILLGANRQTYGVTGLTKAVSPAGAVLGLLAGPAVFCLTAYLCYGFVRGKEPGALLAGGGNRQSYGAVLRAANAISAAVPVKDKGPLRIALRKPLAVLLVFAAVMVFSVFVVLGRSLNISSQKVMESQMAGRHYAAAMRYDEVQSGAVAGGPTYLQLAGTAAFGGSAHPQDLIALYGDGGLFVLLAEDGQPLLPPAAGSVIIGPGLADTYGLRAGDAVTLTADGGGSRDLQVAAVAANAQSAAVYLAADDLTAMAGLSAGAYNGVFLEDVPAGAPAGATVTTQAQRAEDLRRNAVSNRVSAVINQATGVLVSCVLLFLALYVNFQDNTRDMLILHLMGYRNKAIRKLLVDVYRPMMTVAFFVTLAPSIWLAKSIQRSLSISTHDYMPFGTSIFVVLLAFAALQIIYLLVAAVFALGVKRIVGRGEIGNYMSTD